MSHQIKVRKKVPTDPMSITFFVQKMWVTECTCGESLQYWFFGATLGAGLEHIRRGVAADGQTVST
jgi:hypothetical protein